MTLTRTQRKMLTGLQGFQTDGASIRGQIRRNAGVFIYLGIMVLIVVPLSLIIGGWFGGLVIGMILGTLSRDIRGFMRWKKVWPAMELVVDWARVEELLRPEGNQE